MIKADLFQKIIERKEPTWRISSQEKKHFLTILTNDINGLLPMNVAGPGSLEWGSSIVSCSKIE
jgi:hypothetical protein